MHLLPRIEGYLSQAPGTACDLEDIGPFRLLINRETDLPYLSCARPTAPLLGDLQPEIREVRGRFAARGRVARWEFIRELAPELPEALVIAGFPEPEPNPLMTLGRESFHPERAPGPDIRRLAPGADLRPFVELQRLSFGGEPGPVTEEDVRFQRGFLERGWRSFALLVDGRLVSVASHLPLDGLSEIAGVATHPGFRRRGLAGAVTSAAIEDAFAAGCDCLFLLAGDETAQRLYARLGFRVAGIGMSTMDAVPVHGPPSTVHRPQAKRVCGGSV